jgi:hypothetical protein
MDYTEFTPVAARKQSQDLAFIVRGFCAQKVPVSEQIGCLASSFSIGLAHEIEVLAL